MKTAIVLFADTPLLEQAGMSLKNTFSASTRLRLYTDYINDSISYFNKLNVDFWLTCEESFQETLLEQHFPEIKGCRVVNGDMEKKLTTLTDYFLNVQEYDYMTFLFQPFTFFWEEQKALVEKSFRRTARSVVLLTDESSTTLHSLSVSFPFSKLYEDIIWERANRYKQIKDHCEDVGIPCKRLKISNAIFTAEETLPTGLEKQLSIGYPSLYRNLCIALNKKNS